MISNFKEFWGDTLHEVSLDKEIRENLPEDTADFLSTVGLPTSEKLRVERVKYLRATLPPILLTDDEQEAKHARPYFEFAPEKLKMIWFQQKQYVVIGKQESAIIALRAHTGEVELINGERPPNYPVEFEFYPICFLNTTIQACIRFLMIDLQYKPLLIEPTIRRINLSGGFKDSEQGKARRNAIKEMHRMIYSMELEFRSIDERAVTEPNSWWRGYLQDLLHF